jgi:excisionase family DNA binding protein
MSNAIALLPQLCAGTDNDSLFEPLLTAEEAASYLRMHTKTLQRFARSGIVPCARMGKYWRFRLSALDLWVRGHQNQPSQPLRVK